MTLALARFLFGFSVSWLAIAVLLIGTVVCIRLIGIVVVAFDDPRHENIAGAACVLAVIIGALFGIYALAHGVDSFLGTTSWVNGMPNWLTGEDRLSAAAVLGAMVGLASLGGIPVYLRWQQNRPTDEEREALQARNSATTAPPVRTRAAKAAGKSAPPKTTAKAAVKKSAQEDKRAAAGKRVHQLLWFALILWVMAGAVLVFAFSLNPLWPAPDAAKVLAPHHIERAARARYVYGAGAALAIAGALCALSWVFWRRRS